jgi:hypothetical protein
MNQQSLFTKNTIQNIHIYNEASKTESKTEQAVAKISPSQSVAIKAICKEHNLKESAFVRDAIDTHIELFPFKEKLKRHKDLLLDFLDNLK